MVVKTETKTMMQNTYAVKGSGQGGAGWIGRVEERDTPPGHPGRGGVYFGRPQEYSTFEPHMIHALENSGVAIFLYEEEVEVEVKTHDNGFVEYVNGAPPATEATDEHGEITNLEEMDLPDLKILAKEMGLVLKPGQNAKHLVKIIREARGKAPSPLTRP